MKRIQFVLGAFVGLFILACEGPQGPPGYDGLDGANGLNGADGIQGQVFEIEGVDFGYGSADNLWTYNINFSDYTSFDVQKQDAVLVYRFDGTVTFNDGSTEDSWGLIPQNFFLNEGTIQYVSSHTPVDVDIYIDGNFDLSNLSVDYTDGQILRVVILPSDWAPAKLDKTDFQAVIKALGIEEKDIPRMAAAE